MTYQQASALWCDARGCMNVTYWRLAQPAEARNSARIYEHWTSRDDKDYCPQHVNLVVSPE